MTNEATPRIPGILMLDIGGEGRNPGAWNLNRKTHKTIGGQRGAAIPNLIVARGESIPLPDRSVDVVMVERTPLRKATLLEILRVAKPAATVILRHARVHGRDPHRLAVQTLAGSGTESLMLIGRQVVQQTVIVLTPAAL